MPELQTNPAEKAAEAANGRMLECIDQGRSFRLEAGAGAGKTHSLITALRYLIKRRAPQLHRAGKKIACITYTNVAKDEIDSRTDRHPAIYSGTIHSFCWALIKDFQPQLRAYLPNLSNWPERIAEGGDIGLRRIEYNLGHPKMEENQVLLAHDDVLALTVALLPSSKFRRLFADRFPILFIDEYQDTDAAFVDAIKAHVLGQPGSPLFGFFGDAWQKIYGTGCGGIEHDALTFIGKEANFRSAPRIVAALNNMRPTLPQQARDPAAGGFVAVYHTNQWPQVRRTGQHWAGDLPAENVREAADSMKARLVAAGWDLEHGQTKILMLTHRALAGEQGYSILAGAFAYNDSYIKKEDAHIAFFANKLEPACAAYVARHFGAMFASLGADSASIATPSDKVAWKQEMETLLELRANRTICEVLDHLKAATHIPFPESLRQIHRELAQIGDQPIEGEPSACTRLRNMCPVPYREVTALVQFIEGNTPFETKHGVKGAEFENVLVMLGRGWNQYNFGQFLEWHGAPPADKREAYERNRNLFYVVCSRPKHRLALLFTQQLSAGALATLNAWFGAHAVHALPEQT